MASLPPIAYEEINSDYIRHLIGDDARVILEIGAHHGWQTEQFLSVFLNATIYAFEPDPRAIAKFKSRITDPRVHLFEMAIGALDGTSNFHVSSGLPPGLDPIQAYVTYPQGWDQSGSLRPPKAVTKIYPWCKFNSTTAVAVLRLDSWARENGIDAVDFIWADMQGAESDLIGAGQTTLTRTRYLYLEYSNDEIYEGEPTLPMLLDMLPEFSVVKRYPGDVLLKNIHFS